MSIYNDVFLIDEQLRRLQEVDTTEMDVSEQEAILEETRKFVLETGLEKLAKIHANRQAEIKAIKDEEERLKNRRQSLEKKDEWLMNYMKEIFELSGESKALYGTFTFSWRKSTQCVVDESVFQDDRFVVIEEVKKIDKMGIKKALTNGETLPGATLIENQNLQIK